MTRIDAAEGRARGVRPRRRAGIAVVAAVSLAGLVGAAPDLDEQEPCLADALEEWWCAEDAQGTAVIDGLGRVVCAPGACVKQDADWVCSSVAGGAAGLTPEGPVCDGGCRPPSAGECRKL